MITKYDVLVDDNLDDLTEAVQSKIEQGWKCQGGIAAAAFPRDSYLDHGPHVVFYQAIVKEDA